MAEVQLIDAATAPLLAAPFFASGDPGPIVAALAQVPEVCEVALPYIGASLAAGSVGVRAKELVILRTSAMLSCRYCVAAHSVVALDAGLSDPEVRALRNEIPLSEGFDHPDELALLAWTDAVATGRGPVEPALTAAVKRVYADFEVVELANTLGVTMMLNRFCTALDLPIGEETMRRLASAGFTS